MGCCISCLPYFTSNNKTPFPANIQQLKRITPSTPNIPVEPAPHLLTAQPLAQLPLVPGTTPWATQLYPLPLITLPLLPPWHWDLQHLQTTPPAATQSGPKPKTYNPAFKIYLKNKTKHISSSDFKAVIWFGTGKIHGVKNLRRLAVLLHTLIFVPAC